MAIASDTIMEAYVPFDVSLYSYREGETSINSEVNGEKTSGHRTTRNFYTRRFKDDQSNFHDKRWGGWPLFIIVKDDVKVQENKT